MAKHEKGVIDNKGKVKELYKRTGYNSMKKQIERVLLRHIFTQNSLLDKQGVNHWSYLIKDIKNLFHKWK